MCVTYIIRLGHIEGLTSESSHLYISAVREVEILLHWGIIGEEKGDKGAADILNRAFFIVVVILQQDIWRNKIKDLLFIGKVFDPKDPRQQLVNNWKYSNNVHFPLLSKCVLHCAYLCSATVFVQKASITGSECTFDPRQVPAHRCGTRNRSPQFRPTPPMGKNPKPIGTESMFQCGLKLLVSLFKYISLTDDSLEYNHEQTKEQEKKLECKLC